MGVRSQDTAHGVDDTPSLPRPSESRGRGEGHEYKRQRQNSPRRMRGKTLRAGASGTQAFPVRGRVSVPHPRVCAARWRRDERGEEQEQPRGEGGARPARAHRCRAGAGGAGESGGDAGRTAGWWPKSEGLLRPR